MAISALMTHWFGRLYQQGMLGKDFSMLELGPQDINTKREVVFRLLQRITGEEIAQIKIDKIFSGETPVRNSQIRLYECLGMKEYHSLDVADKSASYLADLNYPINLEKKFSVVTNFGTAEHVFNIAAVFESIHNCLEDGGLALHVLPAFNDVNHGFWNVHPICYFDIARENQYTIEDFVYADNIPARTERLERGDLSAADFESFNITREDCERGDFHLQARATWNFVENLKDSEGLKLTANAKYPSRIFDYCFVAMRKQPRLPTRPFQYPRQTLYL